MLEFVNETQIRVPKTQLNRLWNLLQSELKKRKLVPAGFRKVLVLVFLNPAKAKSLNLLHRKKDYATDVLSFASVDPESIGELVLCPLVLIRQAKEHKLNYQDELAYMVIHGVLHLVGLDHETSSEDEKRMMAIQDEIFLKFMEGKKPIASKD